LKDWQDPSHIVNYPRWWAVFVYGGVICLVGAGFNCNLPAKPRELLKSVGLGFALDAASVLAKIGPA
jgi:hypothetical protein